MNNRCPDCMAKGGACYAHGGEVENEKLNPGHRESMPDGMREDLDAMDMSDNQSEVARLNRGGKVSKGRMNMAPKGVVQSNIAKYADGGSVVDDVLKERRMRKMANGGLVDNPVEDDFDLRVDLEPVHTRRDEEHDTESPSLDDESLVGQIIRERRKKRGI